MDSTFNNGRGGSQFGVNSRCSSTEPKSDCSAERSMSTKVDFLHPPPFHSNLSNVPCENLQAADIIDEIFREKLRSEKQRFASSTIAHSDTSTDDDDDDDHLNEYIENHRVSLPHLDIDDISADSDEIEEKFQSIFTATAATGQDGSDLSDNWMFKRRGEDDTSSVVSATTPVGMLVPSPTEDIRTQIGDRNADEIESDLSETGSDLDDSLDDDTNEKDRLNVTIDVPHVLVESKILIGGKNEMASFEHNKLIDLLQPGSLVSEQSLTGQSPVISEAKNELILIDATSNKVDTTNKMQQTEASRGDVETVDDLLDFGPIAMPR